MANLPMYLIEQIYLPSFILEFSFPWIYASFLQLSFKLFNNALATGK